MMQTESPARSSEPSPRPDQSWILKDYLSIVTFQAKRIHRRLPQTVDIEELYSAGLLGLWEACIKFDPAKNVKFLSYAQFRVRGAILDSLRASDWAPRSLRSKGRAAQTAIRTLHSRLGHAPSDDEVAAELGLASLEYQKLLSKLHGLEIGTLSLQHDEDSNEEEFLYFADRQEDQPLFRCLKAEITERLAEAIEDLPAQEHVVISLYYYEELTIHEISLAMQLSPTRVSQIRVSAVIRLRAALIDAPTSFSRGGSKSARRNRHRARLQQEEVPMLRHGSPPTENGQIPGSHLKPSVRTAQAARFLGAMQTAESSSLH